MDFFLNNFIPLFFMGLGGVATVMSLMAMVRGIVSKNWPTCEGTVLASAVRTKKSQSSGLSTSSESDPLDDFGGSSVHHTETSSTTYFPEVQYEYQVDGTTYKSDKVAPLDVKSGSMSRASRIVKKYPKGDRVTVTYNPKNPKQCLLEPGISWIAFLPLAFGLFFFAVGFRWLAANQALF